MTALQVALYLVAAILVGVGAFQHGGRVSLALLGAAIALLAYTLPGLAALT